MFSNTHNLAADATHFVVAFSPFALFTHLSEPALGLIALVVNAAGIGLLRYFDMRMRSRERLALGELKLKLDQEVTRTSQGELVISTSAPEGK
jgi:hypothetical protein